MNQVHDEVDYEMEDKTTADQENPNETVDKKRIKSIIMRPEMRHLKYIRY